MSKNIECEVENLLRLIGGRWKVLILRELFDGSRRHAELKRALPGISQKMLTQRLREFESLSVIMRTDLKSAKPHVEYTLTPFGQELQAIVMAMHAWAHAHAEDAENGGENKHAIKI